MLIENGKNNPIKLKNDLIEKFKKNIRTKKADRDYYEYEENKFHGSKDVRNLFSQNDDDDDDDNYEGIEYLFDESIMNYFSKLKYSEYEEIKKLLSVKPKKELIECIVTKGIIEQEYAIDYDVNYYRANFRRCERVQEIDHIKFKTFLVKESSDYTIDNEPMKFFELVNDQIIESCEIFEDQKVEFCELIENHDAKIIESCEIIEDQKVEKFSKNGLKQEEIKKLLSIILKKEVNKYLSSKHGLEYDEIKKLMLVITKKECSKYGIEYNELIEGHYQKADEDIKIPKSSKNESDKIKELGLTMEELKSIARKIGVKNYENLSRIELDKEIKKLIN